MCVLTMLIQRLGKIENFQEYLDIAMSRSNVAVEEKKEAVRGESRIKKSKTLEKTRVTTFGRNLIKSVDRVYARFPNFDEVDNFYFELISLFYDINKVKKSLGALRWASIKIRKLTKEYSIKINKCRIPEEVNPIRKQFVGRTSSLIEQIREDFVFLEEFRKFSRWLPAVKTSRFTVCISGFPNVGKSTLLSKITTAKPEVDSYAFTTRRINIGHIRKEIQLIDTPGTLNRFDKMNNIEKIAHIAMKNLANKIVYVYDVTLPYPWEEQKKLAESLKEFKVEIIYYLSKTDLLSDEQIEQVQAEIPGIFVDKEELVSKLEEFRLEFEKVNN
jgi:nucleolar GTP-binding protein